MGSSDSKQTTASIIKQNPYSTVDSIYSIASNSSKQIDWLTIMKPTLGLNKIQVWTQKGVVGVKFKAYLAEYAGAPFDLYVFGNASTKFVKFVRHTPNRTIELRGIWVKYPGTNAFVVTSYVDGTFHVNC